MVLEFRRKGRKVSQDKFFKGLMDDALDHVMDGFADELHGKAASIIDPETGKHAVVFVRRLGNQGWSIHTTGSPVFALELEKRLELKKGEVRSMGQAVNSERKVYLAHASEDKSIALPLAEGLISRGIDVWYDNWEICPGDSLRRKMESGLDDCSHFVVLLTANSIKKPWVDEEIDVGLLRTIEGTSKFLGLRCGIDLADLSPFLRTRLTPEFGLSEKISTSSPLTYSKSVGNLRWAKHRVTFVQKGKFQDGQILQSL